VRRAALLVLAVAAVLFALGGAIALADKPEVIDEVDILRVQLAESQAAEAQTRAEALKLVAQQAVGALRAKYKLGDSDSIDPQTRQIRRAPKTTKPAVKL
jgi:hypothetical protein